MAKKKHKTKAPKAKKSCCEKPPKKMCKRCPRRFQRSKDSEPRADWL